MNITLIGKTAISILAIGFVITMAGGIAQNSQAIIDIAIDMFWGVLWALIAITIIINLPRILKVLVRFV